ncbi:hypothetical protein EPA93_22625 [Ktedonosporobacter rubrisoli]|uniref:Uncharacterized protein n=1 Tax=Ktedonosporobacter rubrisoli TaxID=2509675 RepID=A0A4P6JTJ2_KTERU|nr:hypothetical protein [Ktedonosporobacter rubrisoli]QBD78633.1 hypothetical protein EPA93_22625 [Ktedonosporobacter rubrisoli]
MSTHHHNRQGALDKQNAKTISCPICLAVYAPAQTHHYLLHASDEVLESVFVGMCHFCFRCRRPACPACWDEGYKVCRHCVQETGLPMQPKVELLAGGASIWPSQEQNLFQATPLICIHPGHFHKMADPRERLASVPTRPAVVEAGRKQSGKTPSVPATPMPAFHEPAHQGELDVAEIETRPEWALGPLKLLEYVLTFSLTILLAIVIILVIGASISANVNTFIANILHVDIRAEIAYLWQLIEHFFW